jgi:tryptophan synthase beta chain
MVCGSVVVKLNRNRVDLSVDDLPNKWYNILPDLPSPLPTYKSTQTGETMRGLPDAFTRTASSLEFADHRWIEIPEPVLEAYIESGRPTSLIRAHHLENFLQTSARIYYKCESLLPTGSFKSNAALPQAYWAMKEGKRRTVVAGEAGVRTKFAHAYSARRFGIKSTIFLTRAECQKDNAEIFYLRDMLEAELIESPSTRTEIGRKVLAENPNDQGTPRVRDAEVREEVISNKDSVAVSSSFLNHVLMTQTVIGLELRTQLDKIGERPNLLVASTGSGSNLFGLVAPFVRDRVRGDLDVRFLGAESETSCKLTTGVYDYTSRPGPFADILLKTYRSDWTIPPPLIRARGIQTQTTAPILGLLRHSGLVDTHVYPSDEKAIMEAIRIFLRNEGCLIAPESGYTIKAVIDEALEAKRKGEKPTIVASVSATAFLDFGEKSTP